MISESVLDSVRIGIIGLGYVGLPLALAFAKRFPGTIGFDIDSRKVMAIASGDDPCDEGYDAEIRCSSLITTSSIEDLKGCNFFVVTVPTPVDRDNRPDLSYVRSASKLVGKVLSKGGLVVFESTVYPGVTEDICGPEIELASGLVRGRDFKLGYSPERVNPGDRDHSLDNVVKIVSGEDDETLDLVAQVYGAIVKVGVHRSSSIKVAEAAKVVENTQRDLNIALMNELAIIFDRMNVRTSEVLAAASTKWNFLRFSPGLVGGHCIGVDPYYLTSKAEQLGYMPEVILAGRRVNDEMGHFIAQRTVKLMARSGVQITRARVGILGLTFKENVSDVRNSRVPSIVAELQSFNMDVLVHDPRADNGSVHEEYGIGLVSWDEITEVDALIFAVAHKELLTRPSEELWTKIRGNGVFVDVKSVIDRNNIPERVSYWSL